MFCDLVGSTALSTQLDPEDLRKIIGAYHRTCAAVVEQNGGFVAKYMGDGVLVYFGYPRAHEDDAERAIRAALEKYTPLVTLLGPAAGREIALEGAYDRMVGTSIDQAVMESAASDGRVVMARLDAGWSDVGSWTALLAGLGIRGSHGRVVGTAEVTALVPGDLVVRRVRGRLELSEPAEGRADGILDPTGPSAVLSGAADDRPRVEALVERVNAELAAA